jgi:hypothetical protein
MADPDRAKPCGRQALAVAASFDDRWMVGTQVDKLCGVSSARVTAAEGKKEHENGSGN